MPRLTPRRPVRTTTNGKPAVWTDEICEMFDGSLPPLTPDEWIASANYYTPRPYRNQYDRGTKTMGFVYVLQPGYRVCQIERNVTP